MASNQNNPLPHPFTDKKGVFIPVKGCSWIIFGKASPAQHICGITIMLIIKNKQR
jgi:hypothetical protein